PRATCTHDEVEVSLSGRAEDAEEPEYFALAQHPKAKEIYESFSSETKRVDATLGEIEHFRNIYPDIDMQLFFDGENPTSFDYYYYGMEHNIKSYALWKLAEENKIGLFAYDASAALSGLKITATSEVLTPATGKFVVTFDDKSIILSLEINSHNVEWQFFSKNSEEFSAFVKMFREAVKRCNYYTGQVFDQNGTFLDLPSTTFDDIYLEDKIRKEVKSNIIDYLDDDALEVKRKNGIPTKRGVVFVGRPGTGKTFLSRVLANTLKTTFMVIKEVSNPAEIDRIFNQAKEFDRIVLLFEDIDIYIRDRSETSGSLPTMLNHLDGVEVNNHIVVICTTNDVDSLDKALKERPGRFDRILTFNPPDKKLKTVMLKGFCGDKDVSGVDFSKVVAQIPAPFTGAHLKEVYITACNQAIDAGSLTDESIVILTTDIFLTAIDTVNARVSDARIGFGKKGG
ncbi:MAG: AAA family ATPase, partial [Candidatus Baldrarchaeia archaeon]